MVSSRSKSEAKVVQNALLSSRKLPRGLCAAFLLAGIACLKDKDYAEVAGFVDCAGSFKTRFGFNNPKR